MFSSLFRTPQPAPASVTSTTAMATTPVSATPTSTSASAASPTPTVTNTNTNTTNSRSSSARPTVSSPGLPSTTSASSVSPPRAHPFSAAHLHPHPHPHPHGTPLTGGPGPSPGSRLPTNTTSSSSAPVPPTPSTQRQIEEARNAVVASIGNMLDRELSGRAAQLHANNAAIEKQERDVSRAVDALKRENDKLAKLASEHTRKVKEIGNVQYWAEMLEREFLIIEETLRMVKEGTTDDEDDEGGTGSEWSGSECPEGCQCGRGVDEEGDVVMGEAQRNGRDKGKEVEVEPEMVPIPESPLSGEVSGSG